MTELERKKAGAFLVPDISKAMLGIVSRRGGNSMAVLMGIEHIGSVCQEMSILWYSPSSLRLLVAGRILR